MEQNNDILEKIRKLLALSESSNEYEAASALAMAVRLSRKYDIDLEKVKGTVITDKIEGMDIFVRSQIERWVKSLFCGLAPLFGCHCLFGHSVVNTGRSYGDRWVGSRLHQRIIIYGQERDKKAVEYVGIFLVRALRKLWLEHRDEVVWKMRHMYSLPLTEHSIRQDYLCGAVVSVLDKAKELFAHEEEECAETTALVLCKHQAVMKYISDVRKPKSVRLNFGSQSLAGAFGRRDGEDVDILTPIEENDCQRACIGMKK